MGASSWRSLIYSEHNQRCIHRFTIHNFTVKSIYYPACHLADRASVVGVMIVDVRIVFVAVVLVASSDGN